MAPKVVWRSHFILILVFSTLARSQGVVLTPVQVSDASDRPIARVILSAKGDSSTSPPTDKAGKTHLVLPASVAPGTQVFLVLVDSPDVNLRFLSPWEGHATIPLRDAVEIVLGTPGDPSVLANQRVRQSIRGAIAAKGAPGPEPSPERGDQPAVPARIDSYTLALQKVSSQLGLRASDVSSVLQRFADQDAKVEKKTRYRAENMNDKPTQTSAKQNATMQSSNSMQGSVASHSRKH